MKGHWIPPSPKGFIDRIAAKLGYSKTIPSGLGTDLVDAVGALNDQKANQASLAYVETGDNATVKTYTAGEFIVWKGALYTVNSDGIPQGNPITGHVTAVSIGGLNNLLGVITGLNTFKLHYVNDLNDLNVFEYTIFVYAATPLNSPFGAGVCFCLPNVGNVQIMIPYLINGNNYSIFFRTYYNNAYGEWWKINLAIA